MPRAEYDVQKGAPSPADTSFRSCVLAILIFIFLCLVLVLIAVGLRSAGSSEPRAAVAPAHGDSEKVDLKGRVDEQRGDEDIETLTTTTTTTTTSTTTTTTTTTPRPTSRTNPPNVTTTEHPVVTERNASSKDSRVRTVAAAVSNDTTEARATTTPEGHAPMTSRGEPVAHTPRNHTTTVARAATEQTTTPPAPENATTARPQPPPIVFIYSPTSDIPPTYLPSSDSSILVDHGLEVTNSEPHSATSNTTTDSVDTGVSLRFTSSTTLGPRGNTTERVFVLSDPTNDSTAAVNNNVTTVPLTTADRNETTKFLDSSTMSTTPKTTVEVVTHTTNATQRDHSGLRRLIVFLSTEEETTAVTEPSSSENGSSVADNSLLVARNDSFSMTTATTEATAAAGNQTSEDSATPAHVEHEEGSPTTASATWASADNTTKSTLYANTTEYTDHTVTSEETSSRENATVPVTTTEAVTTINSTTAATSENSTTAVPAVLPIVTTTPTPEPRVCETDTCYRQAQRMAAMMNHTVSPCRNFYVTACGGLQTDPLLQQYDPQAEAFHRIAEVTRSSKELPAAIRKLRDFEESCMQYGRNMPDTESRIAEVRKVMDNIGNFSFDDGEWKNFRSKFADLFSTLIKYNSSPLFDVLLDVESKKNPTFVFKLVPPLPGGSIFSGDKRTYECRRRVDQNNNGTEMNNKYFSYLNCIENYDIFSNTVQMVKELGYFKDANETAAEKFNESLTFALIDLHKYMKMPKEADVRQEQFTKDYKLFNVTDLDGMFPLLDWKTLFMKLVEDHHESIGEQVVQVYSMGYFSYVFTELASSAEGEHAFAKDLNNALLAYAAQKLVEDFVEQHSVCDREAYCQYVAYNLMSQAASSAYLQSFTAVDLRRMENRAKETFTHLKNTLNDEFKNAKWLDEESKTEVFEQLRNINLAPYDWESFLLNNTYLDDYYKELNISITNYFQNAVNLVLLNKKHSYSLYLKNPLLPQHIWSHFKYPYQYTGNVIYALNTVVIPIGLLSKFSNDAELPKYINMAGEGLVMAHELAHMFDFVGMKREFHEEDLKLSSHSASVFMDMKMCMNSEYDFKKSHAAEDGNLIEFQTTGALSANERMADYTGMLIAYSTYLKHWGDSEELLPLISNWTPNQLFFLQASQELCSKSKIYHHFVEIFEDVHLPSAIRVQNMVSNSVEFSKVFNCTDKLLCDVFPRNSEPDMNYAKN